MPNNKNELDFENAAKFQHGCPLAGSVQVSRFVPSVRAFSKQVIFGVIRRHHETARERAIQIVGNVGRYLPDKYSEGLLEDEIKLVLKEQDKLTRHAIAGAISVEPDEMTPDGQYDTMLSKSRVHNIAMNTSAL